jgi:hypothetical protein
LIAAAETKRQKRRQMLTSQSKKTFTVVRSRHPREVDAEATQKAKQTFLSADLADHIRKGRDTDLACVAPTLIPVPGAFDGDGRHPMSSYTAENIVFKVKKSMILGNLGYTPQRMLPLYVRNTLIEANGTTPGGDQAYEQMAADKRYSHYMGRPLNRFEPSEGSLDGDGSKTLSSGYGQQSTTRGKTARTASQSTVSEGSVSQKQVAVPLTKEEKHAVREERRQLAADMKAVKGTAMSGSLVRLVFSNPAPSLSDLNYLDEF